MLQVHTADQEGSGENDASSPSNRPTLKEFITQQLGAVTDLYNKLSQVGITDIKILIFIDEKDLEQLCQELGLPFGNKIKFKAAVRELQKKYDPITKTQHSIVTISPTEQAEIDKIEFALKQSNDLQHIFEAHFNEIEDQISNTKIQINTQIDGVIESLQNRKKSLYEQLDEWKVNKLENINKEVANIIQYHNQLKKSKMSINDLLRTSGVSKRDKKIQNITNSIFKNEKFKVYQDIKLLKEFMINNTKLISVRFEEMIKIKELQLFGKLNKNVKNNIFNIPFILLTDVIKTTKNERGYKIKLEWEFVPNEEEKSNDFTIEYMMEDEEKKDEEMDWIILNETSIETSENNKYLLEIAKYFEYDKTYQFKIQHLIEKPLNIIVTSNMKSIIVDGKFNLDISKEESIALNIHSHKGHHLNFVPERILNSEDNFYLSPIDQTTNDWIIFEMKDGNMYYPTKLQVRARGTNQSGSGDSWALKRFCLKIGSSNCNEWIALNEEIFTASKMDPQLQTFNLDIIDNNNTNAKNRIVQKWKSIKSKNYKQFKLEILDNYGQCYILIQEFKIFGVKM